MRVACFQGGPGGDTDKAGYVAFNEWLARLQYIS
jgi:hypothetical protein